MREFVPYIVTAVLDATVAFGMSYIAMQGMGKVEVGTDIETRIIEHDTDPDEHESGSDGHG